jgi:hypothetical protein
MFASDDEQSSLQPGGAGVLALVALLGGWLWVQDLPRSFRDAEPPLHPAVRVLPDGVVDARLWQDPFSAVSEHLAGDEIAYDYVLGDETSTAHRPQPENYRLLRETWSGREGRRSVLVGLLRGVSGAEEAERRRRQRHAIVSALAVSGLEPAHGTSLGWVWYRDEQRGLRLPIFFELFERPRPGSRSEGSKLPDTALVLWMNEDQIGSYTVGRDPLAVISEMVATFLDPILERGLGSDRLSGVDVRILGPSTSDSLRRIVSSREPLDELSHYVGKLPRAAQNVIGWSPWDDLETGDLCPLPPTLGCEEDRLTEIERMIEGLSLARQAAVETMDRVGRRMPSEDWRSLEPHLIEAVDRRLVDWLSAGESRRIPLATLCRRTPEPNDCRRRLRALDLVGSLDRALDDALARARREHFSVELLETWIDRIDDDLPATPDVDWAKREGGPAILHQWLLEWTAPANALKRAIRADLTIHSSRATAPLARLTDGGEDQLSYLRSAVADDEQVLGLVAEELAHRGLDLCPASDDHVVLISEWDTTYGRAMPEIFEQLAARTHRGDTPCPRGGGSNLHRFSYLRGLDGIVPRSPLYDNDGGTSQEADDERPPRPTDSLGVEAIAPLERHESTAFGRNQVDHVERLRRAIVDQDLELRNRNAGRIRAIGVLGSDFHDKQLILQVLRRQFRHAVFFTTDLDARYFDPDKQSWNRNLLVGSSFGLTLRPSLQEDIPPFRDSYSTAAFLATLTALHEPKKIEETEKEKEKEKHRFHDLDRQLTPRLFEISRSGAVDLTHEPRPDTQKVASLHPLRPPRRDLFGGWNVLLLLLPLALVTVTAIAPIATGASRSWRRWLPMEILIPTGTLALVVVLVAIGRSQEASGLGEFVRWLDGVSVWPTEILRVLVLGLALWSLWDTRRRLHRAEAEIAARFFPTAPEPSRDSGPRTDRLRRALSSLGRSVHLRSELSARRTPTPEAAWTTYRRLGQTSARWTRTALYLTLFALAFFGVVRWLGVPESPARGALALGIDRWLQGSVIFGVFTVTLWLFDATFLAWLFVRRLALNRTRWSRANLAKLTQRWGIRRAVDVTEIAEVEVIAVLTRGLWASLGVPFLLVGMLVVSRSRLFDGWTWPSSLVLSFVALLAVALTSTVLLRLRAQRARREALRSLVERSSQREGDGDTRAPGRASVRQIELMAEAIRNERRGALGGWWASPLARTGVLVAVVLILMLLDLTYA